MTTQPEALRLADEIDTEELSMDRLEKWIEEATAELRRLHDENGLLRTQRDAIASVLEAVLRIPDMSDSDLEQLILNCKVAKEAAKEDK